MSFTTPPDTGSWEEATTHGFYGERTDRFPDTLYVPGVQEDVAPTVSGVSPDTGPEPGGFAVTITGTLLFASVVTFGGRGATVTSAKPDGTSVTCTCPANAEGAVDIVVSTAGGSVTVEDGFTYEILAPNPPVVVSFSPASGPNDTVITILGEHLDGTYYVAVGIPDAKSFNVVNDATVTCVPGDQPPGTMGAPGVATPGGIANAPSEFTWE